MTATSTWTWPPWASPFLSWDAPSTSSTSRPTAVSWPRDFYLRPRLSEHLWRADISFAGSQTGDHGESSNPETTVIPSAGAKPDDAIFAYWTDLDFSKGGEVYISTNEEEQTSTITWLDAPYYCHGAGEGEWSSEPDYGPAWHVRLDVDAFSI